jgi:hypothetical protein
LLFFRVILVLVRIFTLTIPEDNTTFAFLNPLISSGQLVDDSELAVGIAE